MHYKTWSSGVPSPLPTYLPKIFRSLHSGVEWHQIETSDGVFDWTAMDARAAYCTSTGQDLYYQIYSTPPTARAAGAAWATVPDQDGVVGAGCQPDLVKLARFVTALLTRYPQIKWLSPWNEPKWGNAVVRFPGATTGSVTAGATVTQVTTGATGTVISNSGTSLVVRLNGPAYSTTPFNGSNQIRVDGGNYFTPSSQAAVWYWFGTKEELVQVSATVYAAAKAVSPSVIVTTPDFVEGANIASEEEWLATWMDAGGSAYMDALGYHFYNYDIRPETRSGDAYSVIQRCDDLDAILAARGKSGLPKIASECGYTPGWTFWTQTGDRPSQAATLQRVSTYLAARGWQGVIWFNHTEEYDGAPSANAANASALAWAGRIGGKAISGAFVDQSNTLQMLVNGMPVAV